MTGRLSFRARIIALVLGVAIVPLVLLGSVLVWDAVRSGERLLSERLDRAMEDTREVMVQRWVPLRSSLLDIASWPSIPDVARGAAAEGLTQALLAADPAIHRVAIRSSTADFGYTFDRGSAPPDRGGTPPPPAGLMRFQAQTSEPSLGGDISVTFGVDGTRLLPPEALPPSTSGMVVALLDGRTGAPLTPVPVSTDLLTGAQDEWGGEQWLAARQSFRDPPVELVVLAPLTPYVAPFRRSARNGSFLLAAIGLIAFAAAVVLTNRMTGSLKELVEGTEAVAGGDLARRIDHTGDDEIGRVTKSFNSMAESLDRMMKERASRESLAAMGEMAASLAHEIRNPLTAMKIDLQGVEEKLEPDSKLNAALGRVLDDIGKLDRTVGDALSLVRRSEEETLFRVSGPIEAGVRSARPRFEDREATLEFVRGNEDPVIRGDASALERLILNLLINAADAVESGGQAKIELSADDGHVQIVVEDSGSGIPADLRERVFEPLFSTKETGTGLGLTISRRIARAHGGEMSLSGSSSGGARFTVRLPQADPGAA